MTGDIKIFHILSPMQKLTLHYATSWLALEICVADCYVKLDSYSSILSPGRRHIANGTSDS